MGELIKNRLVIPMNLSLFNSSSQEKTEEATPKKRKKAREEGQVAKSQEVGTAATFLVMFGSMLMFTPMLLNGISNVFFMTFGMIYLYDSDIVNLHFAADLAVYVFQQIILISLPLLLLSLMVGIVTNIIQVKWNPTTKPLMPKFSKLNPLSGLKKIFGIRSLMELAKSLLKLTIIGMVIYIFLVGEMDNVAVIMYLPVVNSFSYIGSLIIRLGITVGAWFILIAAMDYFFQKRKHEKDLKMSKQEVKEEYKQAEGNPQIKSKIRQKMREAGMRRMMQDIPQADVIITNPTHYSVAISYDRNGTTAPKVVAKGVDHLALRIREIAKESKVTIVENVQLARALYVAVDVGNEIPQELYKAVAEILAHVYKLKNLA